MAQVLRIVECDRAADWSTSKGTPMEKGERHGLGPVSCHRRTDRSVHVDRATRPDLEGPNAAHAEERAKRIARVRSIIG